MTEQDAFEKLQGCISNKEGQYDNPFIQCAWQGFQAGCDYRREVDAVISDNTILDMCPTGGEFIGTLIRNNGVREDFTEYNKKCAEAIRNQKD